MHSDNVNFLYYHLIIRGECRSTMFYTAREYIATLNSLALSASKYKVTIISFCILGNHLHVILRADPEVYTKFVTSFRISLSINVRRIQGVKGRLGSRGFKCIILKDEEDLRDAILYCLRNPLHHNIVTHLKQYRWNSCSLYYSNFDNENPQMKINTDPEFIRRHLPTHRVLPEGWLMSTRGQILPQCYVDTEFVEKLFGDRQNFIGELRKKTGRELRNEQEEDTKIIILFSDVEVIKSIALFCKEHKRSYRPPVSMPKEEKFEIARFLRANGKANSILQISRILAIPPSSMYLNLKRD